MSHGGNRNQLPGMGGGNRDQYGCVMTFENADGKRLVIHRLGNANAATHACCETALRLDPTFRVICYSSPQTVYADILGRIEHKSAAGTQTIQRPEPQALSRAGLAHLIHPSIDGTGRTTVAKRRAET